MPLSSRRDGDGRTGRTLLVVDDPHAFVQHAVAAGATETPWPSSTAGSSVAFLDPFGHEWEIGKPIIQWPARLAAASGRGDV
jgi:PhnB protein